MMLSLKKVSKHFGTVTAVNTASFTVNKGEIVGFVGANGAGKSTTIGLILGFIAPSSGDVQLFGDPVRPFNAHQSHQRIGYAAGDMELPRRLTGRQFLRFVGYQYGGQFTKRLEKLEALFQPELDKKIGALSRGNKQKIALIAAFLAGPELVVLDEPTSGLDPIMQEKFLQLVRDERERGTTIFMSSHYLNEVADVCTRVILMRQGRIITDTTAEELFKKSGKQVRVVSGYGRLGAPRGASDVVKTVDADKNLVLTFDWKAEPARLQQWLIGVRQLIDIEITEYNLEAAFAGMYDDEAEEGSRR